MIKKEELITFGMENLSLILKRQGELIYSSHETIKKGDIYLLGYNPGGGGNVRIEEHLNKLLTNTNNAYLDEEWDWMHMEQRIKIKKGEARLQKQVHNILRALGYNTREVCASNLIFVTSRSSNEVDSKLADYCWVFHEKMLEIIQPKLLLCFGLETYYYLQNLLHGIDDSIKPLGYSNIYCRAFKSFVNNKNITIVGIPHLSWHKIDDKKNILKWIQNYLTE